MCKEIDLQKVILEYLNSRNIFAWRNNSGIAFYKHRVVSYGAVGSPDIIGIMPNGRFLGIEVKNKKGRLSENQKKFLYKIEQNGGVAIVARSLDDVIKVIEK